MLKVYAARSMTGRIKKEVVAEARHDKQFMEDAGIAVLCPVISEKVKASKTVLNSSTKQMNQYWPRDKQMIRECHVLFDMTPERKSEGVAHEIGYARYFLWKPVVRVYKNSDLPSEASVAFYEDDLLVSSLDEACRVSLEKWGTRWKRFVWRVGIYRKSLLKALVYQFSRMGEIMIWNPWRHVRLAGGLIAIAGLLMSHNALVWIGLLVQYVGVAAGVDLTERRIEVLEAKLEEQK